MIMGRTYSRRRTILELAGLTVLLVLGVIFDRYFDEAVVNTIIQWLVALAAPAPTLFVIYYSRNAWRTSDIGRALMALSVSIATVLWLNVTSIWLGDYDGRPIVRLVVYSALLWTLWRLFVTLRRDQIRITRELRTLRRINPSHHD